MNIRVSTCLSMISLVLALSLGAIEVEAQKICRASRTLLRLGITNGAIADNLDYPHDGSTAGSYGSVSSAGGYSWSPYGSAALGLWILTGDGKVSLTGPRTPSSVDWTSRIKPAPYDPNGKPEQAWGLPNPIRGLWKDGGSVPVLATYWPDITKTDDGSIYANEKREEKWPVVIANYRLSGYIENPDLPEEILIGQWTSYVQGIQTQARMVNWSNPDFDDFILVEYTFTNTGDKDGDGKEDRPGGTPTQDKAFFAFVNRVFPTNMGSAWATINNTYDEIYLYTGAANYAGKIPPALRASVWRDSDSPSSYQDDTGEPFDSWRTTTSMRNDQTEGQMQAAATWAMVPVAFRNAGASHIFNPRDRAMQYVDPTGDQPFAARWWKVRSANDYDDPTPDRQEERLLHQAMTTPGIMGNPDEANPIDRIGYVHAQVFGPYTLPPGKSARIVMAYVAGHPAQMKPDPRQGVGTMDLLTWDRSEEPVEKKQAEMKTLGEQALLENIRLAAFAYETEGRIPPAPTNVFISAFDLASSANGHQQISWSDDADRAVNPVYKEQDVLGYRVYRSIWRPVGPWELRDTIEKGKGGKSLVGSWSYAGGRYTYEDLESLPGWEYHYSVRPFASGHSEWSVRLSDGTTRTLADIPVERARANVAKGFESGWGSPTARTYDGIGRRPFLPVTVEGDRMERRITVVPNPYRLDQYHKYPGSENIRFVGLPRKCTIHIYSVSGDRIQTITHDETFTSAAGGVQIPKTTGQRGEYNFAQYTWNLAGQISTGLYFYVVVSNTPGSEGKHQRGSFLVIK